MTYTPPIRRIKTTEAQKRAMLKYYYKNRERLLAIRAARYRAKKASA